MKNTKLLYPLLAYLLALIPSNLLANDFDQDYLEAYKAYQLVSTVQYYIFEEETETEIDSRMTPRYFNSVSQPYHAFESRWDFINNPYVQNYLEDLDAFESSLPSPLETLHAVCSARNPRPRMYVFADKLENPSEHRLVFVPTLQQHKALREVRMDDISLCEDHIDRDEHYRNYEIVSWGHFSDDTCDHIPHCRFEWDKSIIFGDDLLSIHARHQCLKWELSTHLYILKKFNEKYAHLLQKEEL